MSSSNPTGNKRKDLRRRLIVEPHFQWRFVIYTVTVAALVVVTFFLADQYFFWRLESYGSLMGLAPNHPFFRFIGEQRRLMNWVFLGAGGLSMAIFAGYAITFSNRIAGPIYKIRLHLEQAGEARDFSPIQLRKNDFFGGLAQAANQALIRESAPSSEQ